MLLVSMYEREHSVIDRYVYALSRPLTVMTMVWESDRHSDRHAGLLAFVTIHDVQLHVISVVPKTKRTDRQTRTKDEETSWGRIQSNQKTAAGVRVWCSATK